MKKVYVFATLLLMAGMAMGQNPYGIQSKQSGFRDITTMTNTVSAWKQFGSSCRQSTLASGAGYRACVMNDGYVYTFDVATKAWDKQTAMGLGVVQLAVANPSAIFALISAPQCTSPSMGIFLWTGSAWSQKGGCYTQISAGTNGTTVMLSGINNINQMWFSTDEGNSWTIQSDSWIYASFGREGLGCAVDTSHAMWGIANGQLNGNLPAISSPNGSVVGCLQASSPLIAVAWTSTGWVYSMPQENWGTWSVVAGIAAQAVVGQARYYLFGEDTGFKVYHWNVHAPGASATYGGQWNPNNGCPSPGQICNPSTTHHLKAQLRFTSGHGVDGRLADVTQLWNSSFSLTSQDYNPLCDPFVSLSGDVECQMVMDADAECNQSHAMINDNAVPISSGNLAIDDTAYSFHWADSGGANLIGTPTEGVWTAWSQNVVTDVCPIGTTTSCPMPSPENTVFTCGFGNAAESIKCYDEVMGGFSLHNIGGDAPYTSYDVYTVWQLPDGTQFKECLGSTDEPDIFWYQNYTVLPACR